MLRESYKNEVGDFKAEAWFYLESNNFDTHKAIEEFKKDEAFENHVKDRNSNFWVIYKKGG